MQEHSTNTALIFAIVAGAITFTSLITTKEIGLGMTVAVLVDATIIPSLLVPATMRLLGRWNWWLPGRALPPRQGEVEVEFGGIGIYWRKLEPFANMPLSTELTCQPCK